MVLEEAYLRNFLGLADDIDSLRPAPGFYEGREFWCSATWVGPARGSIDPVKEIQATIMALENHLTTYGEAWAERGGDFSDALPVMEEERRALEKLMDDPGEGNPSEEGFSLPRPPSLPKTSDGEKDEENEEAAL